LADRTTIVPNQMNLTTEIPINPAGLRDAPVDVFLDDRDHRYRRYYKAFLESQLGIRSYYYMPRYQRDSQERVDWAAFQLRDQYSLTYHRIALLLQFRGESSARMAVNRYRARNLGVERGYAYQLGTGVRRRSLITIDTRTFGVELEFKELDFFEAARVVERATGRHCHSTDYHGRTCLTCRQRVGYAEWKVEHDGSVCRMDASGNKTGGEAIAPVGCGDRHIDEISRVMVALRSAGAVVDRDAGMHMHMSVKDLSREQLAQFVLFFQAQQAFLWGLVAPSRRGNGYCDELSLTEANNIAAQFRAGRDAYGPRGALNISPYPRLGTFEIRMHQGTLNARKMKAWVLLQLAYAQSVKEDKHQSYQADLTVLGSLTRDGFLDQQVGSYLFARHAHFSQTQA
jgi:hypothetical protein